MQFQAPRPRARQVPGYRSNPPAPSPHVEAMRLSRPDPAAHALVTMPRWQYRQFCASHVLPMKLILNLVVAIAACVLAQAVAFAQTTPSAHQTAPSQASLYVQPNTSFSNPYAPGGIYDPYHGPRYELHRSHSNSASSAAVYPDTQNTRTLKLLGASLPGRHKRRVPQSSTTYFPNRSDSNSPTLATCINRPHTNNGGQIMGNGASSASTSGLSGNLTNLSSCANPPVNSITGPSDQDKGKSSSAHLPSQKGTSKLTDRFGGATSPRLQ